MDRVARFEKVSWEQFQSDYVNILGEGKTVDMNWLRDVYDNIKLPTRKTLYSAGHDISIPFDYSLAPGCKLMIPTGVKCFINSYYVMLIVPRSSIGIKKGLRLNNTVAVVDSDYANADNEGHIFVSVINDSNTVIKFKAGDDIVQAIFVPYGVTNEDGNLVKRGGGIGSTGK